MLTVLHTSDIKSADAQNSSWIAREGSEIAEMKP
jgi:hypothetical protein